jgi:uncharacterized integral membrane protein
MRYVYMALIALFVGVIVLFKVQNLEAVTVSLFSASITLPVSVLVLLIYVLGMLTGGLLLALLRTWVRGGRRGALRPAGQVPARSVCAEIVTASSHSRPLADIVAP